MTVRASILLAIATAPVAVLRWIRARVGTALVVMGEHAIEAGCRIAPDDAPEPTRLKAGKSYHPMILRCQVCEAEMPITEWLIGWAPSGAGEEA